MSDEEAGYYDLHDGNIPKGWCMNFYREWNRVTEEWNRVTEELTSVTEELTMVTEEWNMIAEELTSVTEELRRVTEALMMVTEEWNRVTEEWNRVTEEWNRVTEELRRRCEMVMDREITMRITLECNGNDKKHRFKPGDYVVVLDGSDIPGYAGGWMPNMEYDVGTVQMVTDTTYENGRPSYELSDSCYEFDERGLIKYRPLGSRY